MSKLDKLIEKHCPNGVKYVAIKDYFTRLKGTPITAGKMKEIESIDGDIRIFAGGKTVINAHEEDIPNANITRVPAVLVQSRGVIDFIYYETFKNEMWTYTSNNKVTVKYLYYVLRNNVQYFRDSASGMGSLPQISLRITEDFKIPVPPFEVQSEIVKILDNFTELSARKKQYAYYRDLVLDFSTDGNSANKCEWLMLGEVIYSLNTGLNPRQFFQLNTDDAENHYITIREIRNGKIVPNEKTDRINDEALRLCNNRSNLEVGDVLFSGTGTIGETAVITENPTNWNIKEGVYTIKPIQSKILPFFLHYVLQTEKIKNAYMKKAAGGTVKSIPMGELKKIIVPVPPIEEQERIVQLLIKFDKLCNDISEGLPAEIESRYNQYEYYRDKLLTFTQI